MSVNRNKSWVVRPLTIAFAMVLSLVLGISANPARAVDSYGTPPTFSDGCEGNDFVTIPDYGFASWYINGLQYVEGDTYPAPSASVTVTSIGGYVGTWEFTFANVAPCPPQAPNKFSAYAGACDLAARETPAFGVIENVVDASGLKLDAIYISTTRLQDGWDPGALDVATDILDGETRTVSLDGTQDVGLLPGDYRVTFMTSTNPASAIGYATFSVGACYYGVPNYPSNPGNGAHAGKPTGKLKQIRGTTKMMAVGNNKKVAYTTKFKVVIKPAGKKAITKSFKVRRNKLGKPRTYKFPVGTKYVLKAQVRSVNSSGRTVTKWRVVKTKISKR